MRYAVNETVIPKCETSMWIPVTLVAAAFQTSRTALQHRLRALLSVSGAGFVRYVYGAPLSALAVLVAWRAGVAWPHIDPRFWPVIAGGGIAQILGTIFLIRAFDARDFAVGTVFSKTEVVQVAVFSTVLLGEPLQWGGWVGRRWCAWSASRCWPPRADVLSWVGAARTGCLVRPGRRRAVRARRPSASAAPPRRSATARP